MRLTGLTGAEAGAPPSSPAKLRIAALHPNDKKIVMAMMEEDGGITSVTMVAADNDGGCGGHCPNRGLRSSSPPPPFCPLATTVV